MGIVSKPNNWGSPVEQNKKESLPLNIISMFTKKQSYLIGTEPVKTLSESSILTTSGNGSIKLTTTGNPFVDQFAFITNYRQPRPYHEIDKDMRILWDSNPVNAMKLLLYIRLVTRKVDLIDGQKLEVQRGQGLKHEGIMRMIWVHINYPTVFYQNLPLFVAAGCWKDLFQMLSYDLQYHGWSGRKLDWNKLGLFILAGLENPNTLDLVKKYLPSIKAKSKAKTLEAQANVIIGKYIAHLLFGHGKFSADTYHTRNYESYRKLKSSGTAHQWQQQISQGRLNIDFGSVHGRALSLLVSGKFLKNNGLENRYEEWIKTQPVAKFTGYVYELFKGIGTKKAYQKMTVDKQFNGLIETAIQNINRDSTFIVCRDTSDSMCSLVKGLDISSHDFARAMALYFSYMLEGPFKEGYLEFNSKVIMRQWAGKTPSEKYINDSYNYYGSTNFLGVAHYLSSMRNKYPESIFPKGVICISDGEFDSYKPSGGYGTVFEEFKRILRDSGFTKEFVDDFKIVLWDVPNGFYSKEIRPKFESLANSPNFFYMSGLDPAGIAFLMGKEGTNTEIPKTPAELFAAAMNQELLNLVVL